MITNYKTSKFYFKEERVFTIQIIAYNNSITIIKIIMKIKLNSNIYDYSSLVASSKCWEKIWIILNFWSYLLLGIYIVFNLP